jgi:hypothetical protein
MEMMFSSKVGFLSQHGSTCRKLTRRIRSCRPACATQQDPAWAGGVVQVVECCLTKCKALSSNSSITKKWLTKKMEFLNVWFDHLILFLPNRKNNLC